MSVSRLNDVIDAIDGLIEDEVVEPAPVRFTPGTLTDEEIEDFITSQLARGEDGAATVAHPPVRPATQSDWTPVPRPARRRTATRPARRRSAAPVEPRPNRYASVCVDCDRLVAAGEGVLTRGRGKWLVRHNECPTTAPAPRPTRRRRTPAAVEPVVSEPIAADGDCYVVTVEIEVVKDGVGSAREAALLALREVFTGEVAVTVTGPDNRVAEVNVTV